MAQPRSGLTKWRLVVQLGAALALSAGCTAPADSDSDRGSDLDTAPSSALGIARFVTEDSANVTTVIGLDAEGLEIGRLDLVHGSFAASPTFRDDFDTDVVDGRKLAVTVKGQRLDYETAGFEPIMGMPAHPPDQWALAAFLAAPQVKVVLDRWQLGFEPFEGPLTEDEAAYVLREGYISGHWVTNNDGSTQYPNPIWNGYQNNYAGFCGGAVSATARTVLLHAACDTEARDANNQWYSAGAVWTRIVTQFCPANTGGKTVPWWGKKYCPYAEPGYTQLKTRCGDTTATTACKGCPTYDGISGGFMMNASDGWNHVETGYPVEHIYYSFNQ